VIPAALDRMPKALYTIPVGQNPTGGRLPPER